MTKTLSLLKANQHYDLLNPLSILEGPGWRLEVDPQGNRERLDCFIARRLLRVSRARAARLEVWRLDDIHGLPIQRLKKSTRLTIGSHLWVRRPLPTEDLSTLCEPQVIDETDHLLIIAKPSGWVTHPTASRYLSAITTWLKNHEINAHPVHRLDQETSGLLLCAKDKMSESILSRLFTTHEIDKDYLAITRLTDKGKVRLRQGSHTWTERISMGFDQTSEVGLKMGEGDLKAITDCELLAYWRDEISGEERCLIRATPLTGRQHQIRVHLSLAGFPLLGDKLYGKDENYFLRYLEGELTLNDMDILGHNRQALHAERMSLLWHGQRLEWRCSLASDLQQLLPSPLKAYEAQSER